MKLFARKESWTRFAVKVVITLAVLWLAGSAFASRYRIGYDPQEEKCLPGYSVYLIDLRDQVLERGEIYAFSAQGMAPFFEDGTLMVKILRGLPGDTVEINARSEVTVNGETVGSGLHYAATLGKPETQFQGKAQLGANNYWFMGESPVSFDSRYWGAAKGEQVIGRAYPLF